MAAESSFDIVNRVDHQEVANAVNLTAKEISQRFDFKNVDVGIRWVGDLIEIQANTDQRSTAALDVLKDKLVKRKVSLKNIEASAPKQAGKLSKILVTVKSGIGQDDVKKIVKLIRESGPKGVRAQVQGDELRISSKSRDDLQEVQRLIEKQEYAFAVQFVNYR